MRIDGPQFTGSFNLNGDTVGNLNVFATTGSLNSFTSSSTTKLSSLNTFTSSATTRLDNIETSTGSLNSFTSSANGRLNSVEGVSGSYATTGSNVFVGTQTSSGSIVPSVNNTYDLGSPTHQFRHVYISSGSLYVNGTKVLGSTAQELQITTDAGQSFKILESSSDTITLQSADGNITLATSGGGDVIMDPTNGVIGLKGTVTIYTGNKITSSDGNSIQFGNGIAVTGSIVSTTTSLVSGSSQISYSGLSGVPSDIISGSGQLTTLGIATTGSNTFNGNLTVTGFIDTQELRTTYISSSILYRSGSTKFGDELTDTHSFTGSILISGSISVPGSNLVSGSSQVLNGSGVFSGSAQLPSGLVSSSAQTIANLPSGVVSGSAQTITNLPSGTVSGSVQVDVMSTTNIARLATTGSNVFTGALTGTTATFSGDLTIGGQYKFSTASSRMIGGSTDWALNNNANVINMIHVNNSTYAVTLAGALSGTSATFSNAVNITGANLGHSANKTTLSQEGSSNGAFWQSYGTNSSTVGLFTLRQYSSDGSVSITPLSISSTGAATLSNTLSVGGTIYANTGNEYLRNTAGAVNNAQFQTWFNSAGTRRGYFGYGSGGSNTLELNNESGGQVIFNGGDIIANGSYFRMKGSGDSAEFIWYKDYSGSPSQPGFVINNRAGVSTFSHNANGGGTSITGNFSSANFSGTHSGTSSGTNTGDQTNISGNANTSTIAYSVVGGNGGSVTLGGATDTFYPVLFGIGSGATSKQGIAVLQIERGGYDNPGYSNYGFGTFMARFRCKADGWGYGGHYNHLEQHSYTIPMLAKFEQNNFSSELIVWLRGGHTYQWLSIEGSWGLNNANSGATSVTNGYGNNTYYPTQTNDIGGLSKYYIGWSASRWSGALATDTLAGSGNRAVYSDGGGTLTNSSSDVTLKTNIQNINYGLDSILSLRPVSYNWIEEKRGLQKEIGFIAQEVREHIPEVIGVNSDETLSLDYPKLTAVLTKAIKEQQEMINLLRTEIEILKNK